MVVTVVYQLLVRKKHRVFKKYKDKDHPTCKRASRVASCEVKKAKYNFERKLVENIKKDTKSFYAYVKGRAKVAGAAVLDPWLLIRT